MFQQDLLRSARSECWWGWSEAVSDSGEIDDGAADGVEAPSLQHTLIVWVLSFIPLSGL